MSKFIELTEIATERKIYVNSISVVAILEYGEFRIVELFNGKSYSVTNPYDDIVRKLNKAGQFTIQNREETLF